MSLETNTFLLLGLYYNYKSAVPVVFLGLRERGAGPVVCGHFLTIGSLYEKIGYPRRNFI